MRVEAEPRRSIGVEPTRPVTNHVASAVATRASVPDRLDWQSFSSASFPGRRRHDLEALIAYGAYRSAPEVDAQSSDGLARIEAKRGQAGSTAVQDWEGEGGAAF
jgi:hypothetical protein